MKRATRLSAGAALLATAAGAFATPALAEEAGTYVPNGLKKVSSGPSGGGGVQTQSTFAYHYTCNQPWVPVEAAPSDFVIGSCASGWDFWGSYSGTGDGLNWIGGQIGQDFTSGNPASGYTNVDPCGWIDTGRLVAATGTGLSNCTSNTPSHNRSDYIAGYGAGNPQIWGKSDGGLHAYGTDGSNMGANGNYLGNKNCEKYANFTAWASNQWVYDDLGAAAPHDGTTPGLRERYIAAHTDAGGNQWTMVHDPNVGAGGGNWYWVQNTCLTNQPAAGVYSR